MRKILALIVLANLATVAAAADKLVVISPHRKSLQDEYIQAFKDYYEKTFKTAVEVEWLDQGGTSDDVRFIKAKFEKNPKTADIDIFWGGGGTTFIELNKMEMLASYNLPSNIRSNIPDKVAGVMLVDPTMNWYGSAISSFGIFFNKKALALEGLTVPKSWQDLASPKFFDQLSLTDPRASGSAAVMNQIILQSLGFENGVKILAEIAGNVKQFTHSSSDPIKAVVNGDVVAAMAIDFYAMAKVSELGVANVDFVLPEGQTILDPDPIAMLKGAPNKRTAARFIDFVLSEQGQNLLVLDKGVPGGPKLSALGRMAVNKKSYEIPAQNRLVKINPFEQKSTLNFDADKAAKLTRPFNDLVGALFIDTHKELKSAWKKVSKSGLKPEDVKAFAASPVTEAELIAIAAKWEDEKFRNETINKWVAFARAKYKKLAGES